MSYDEFKELCRKSWEEENDYLCIHRSDKKYPVRYCNYNASKTTYTECAPQTKRFKDSKNVIYN